SWSLVKFFALILCAFSLAAPAQQFTRGLGVYPGEPKEYDGPSLVVDSTAYRNVALHRPAYQSSACDYNLTAQPVTDGIKETSLPRWVVTSTSDRGVLPKTGREAFLMAVMRLTRLRTQSIAGAPSSKR